MQFNIAETELKICISNEESEKNKLEHLQKLHETSAATIQERTKQITELNKKIPATQRALNEANVELLRLKQEEPQIINTIRYFVLAMSLLPSIYLLYIFFQGQKGKAGGK